MKIEDPEVIQLELKYCERCGALWCDSAERSRSIALTIVVSTMPTAPLPTRSVICRRISARSEEVGKDHYLGMKYLFEMIRLYPAASTDDTLLQESLAATLLRRLGLPEAPMPEANVTKDSGTPVAASEDVLE